VISLLQDKAASAIEISGDIDRLIDELSTCDFETTAFTKVLIQIQKIIDHLNLENYSNLDVWVAGLNDRIHGVLRARSVQAVGVWCTEFVLADEGHQIGDDVAPGGQGSKVSHVASYSSNSPLTGSTRRCRFNS
jgi:dynein heavy chain 1